jgi:hypothetical protein
MTDEPRQGVRFPPDTAGKRSSLAFGQRVMAAALREASDDDARRAEQERDWRRGYIAHVVAQERVACRDSAAAIAMAAGGLDALQGLMHYSDRRGPETSLGRAAAAGSATGLEALELTGKGRTVPRARIPWQDGYLEGDTLVAKLADWENRGIAEAGATRAVETVLRHPEWLDLGDLSFVLLGAGAELSPAPFLAAHGAHLIAVDLPGARSWERLVALATTTPCRLTLPGRDGEPGVDLLTDLPALTAWLSDLPGPLVVSNMAYADGARHLMLAAAGDALIQVLTEARDDIAFAALGTPTDAYAIPASIAAELRRDPARRPATLTGALASLTGQRVFAPNLTEIVTSHDDTRWALYDGLVGLQGANYALAKRIQRWRCLLLADAGRAASFNVAPAAYTHSVTDHPAFAAAYAGASLFGAEIFPPDTAAALMALLLVHDLRTVADRGPPAHPADLYAAGSVHGGFWRSPYRPRSVIGLAAAKGLPGVLLRRGRGR